MKYISFVMLLLIVLIVDVPITDATPTCCKNFATSQGTIIESFENFKDWIKGGGLSITNDTSFYIEGNQGIRLNTINGIFTYATKNISQDFSGTQNIVFWIYVFDKQNLSQAQVRLSSWSNMTQSMDYIMKNNTIKEGWNAFVINKDKFTRVGNESWNNVMIRLRIAAYPISGKSSNVTFDNFRKNYAGRPKLIYTFDDGYTSVYRNASDILSKNNQRGVTYVVTNIVGGDNRMTLDELIVLKKLGWDISSHTKNHVDLTTLSSTDLSDQLIGSFDWLASNGFRSSAYHIAYPFGRYNSNIINEVSKTYVTGRSDINGGRDEHPITTDNINYILKEYYPTSGTSITSIKNAINDTIQQNGMLIIGFHDIVNNTADEYSIYTYLRSDLKNISDYVTSRSADIDVITLSDYLIYDELYYSNDSTNPVYNNINPDATVTYTNGLTYKVNATIMPSSAPINISFSSWNDRYVAFNESSSNNNLQVFYEIGDRIPNQPYRVIIYWTNGTKYKDFNILANSTGYIKYNSEGFGDSRYQEINITSRRSSFNIFYNVI